MISYRDVASHHELIDNIPMMNLTSLVPRLLFVTLSNLHRRKTGFSFQMQVFERNPNDIAPASTLYE